MGVTVEPDALIYGRVLQGEPLSGSARALMVWGGRVLSPRWCLIGELSTAREFATDALLVAFSPSYIVALDRRHRDLSMMGVAGQLHSGGAGNIVSRSETPSELFLRSGSTTSTTTLDRPFPSTASPITPCALG